MFDGSVFGSVAGGWDLGGSREEEKTRYCRGSGGRHTRLSVGIFSTSFQIFGTSEFTQMLQLLLRVKKF